MTRSQPKSEEADDGPVAEVAVEDQGVEFTSWEFLTQPTTEEVFDKLKTLPDWWGLRPEAYMEFIQPLSQSKNFAQPGQQKDYRTVWTLYITVAGRLAMIRDAANENDWQVNFAPEPVTPTGIPGMLQFDSERIVYREYVEIIDRETGNLIGRKPGTAWVPASGGGGAVGSNRFEKVETSARGRAIAAWGFGILPGSGVASLDEMLSLSEIRQAVQQQNQQVRSGERPRQSPEELRGELMMKIEEFAQVSGSTEEQMDQRVKSYVKTSFGKDIDHNADGSWNFEDLKVGEIVLFRNRMISEIQRIKNEQGM